MEWPTEQRNRYCAHLDPQQRNIDLEDGEEIPKFHECGFKRARGDKNTTCSFSFAYGEMGVLTYTEYNPEWAVRCPMFTLDSAEADRQREASFGLESYMHGIPAPVVKRS